MVGFEDGYDLYFKGNRDKETAFVEVKIFGSASADVYDQMTGAICKIFEENYKFRQTVFMLNMKK